MGDGGTRPPPKKTQYYVEETDGEIRQLTRAI
jgi:hypothetical protein